MLSKTETHNAGKTRLLFSIALGIAVLFYVFLGASTEITKPEAGLNPPSPDPAGEFLIGALHDGADTSFKYIKDSLGFNLWHIYLSARQTSGKWYPTGWLYNGAPGDSLFAGYSDYVGQVQSALNNIGNHEMKTLLHRPKIEYLCYGQRSDYQCEPEGYVHENYRFYTFNDHNTGVPDTDSGKSVIHCRTMPANPSADDPGFVVKRLKANTEQCHAETTSEAYRWDSQSDWLIKPRIRIDSAVVVNAPNTPVCKIIALNQNRDTIKNIVIKAINFQVDIQHPYRGQYLEEYFFGQNDSTLAIHGAWGDWWWYSARGTRTTQQEQENFNKADIQVYWYGNCDMWLDYVRVDNDIAHNLLTTDTTNQTHQTYMQWLQWEAQYIACYGNSPYQFYIELFEFNNIPCISYVSRKIDEITYSTCGRHFNVMADALTFYQCHMSWNERGIIDTPEKIKAVYLDSIRANQIFLGDPYPLIAPAPDTCIGSTAVNSQIPTTLNISNDTILANVFSSPATYDAWLQGQLDTVCTFYQGGWDDSNHLAGVYLYLLKHGDEISKLCEIPFITMIQAHQWVGGGEVDRDPTNEELNLMTNLAVTYGARGIIYWGFSSFYESNCKYCLGIMHQNITPREKNLYGQPKWDTLKAITARLKSWGPTLMSFNNDDRHSYIYRLERTDCLNETFFYDLITYKPGSTQPCVDDNPLPGQNPPQGLVYECYEDRYLQVATFRESSTERRTYPYFMLVNRRCSPYINESSEDNRGGKRNVRVIFDGGHSELAGYNNWEIKNVEDGSVVGSFNKTVLTLVDLGWYMPGEAKLYHLVPTAKVGGELLADELIKSGEDFTCEDTVWTNGYNLTIENGVTIHFSDSAKFVVESGTFQIGDDQYSGPNNITMDAAQSNSWKGFEFNGATVKIYNTDFSGLANDSIAMLTMIDCPLIDLRNNSFSLGTGNNKSAIDISYVNQMVYISNAYIGYNIFSNSSTELPYVKVMAYSGFTTPIIVESNSFTGTSTVLFLNNIQGGAIKSNTFSGFGRAVTALTSSLDVFENTITSTGAYGLEALSGTELKMSYSGGLLVGGKNNITNSDSSSYNIYLENSYFLMNDGENIFDVDNNGYHLYGWFPDSYGGEYGASENCFKVTSTVVDPPLHYVTLGEQGNQITDFQFTPYLTGCTQEGGEGMLVINLGDGIYDTVGILGQGGSYSSKYVVTPKTLYDSISISMRFRNYANVKSLCLQLLNSYPDSIQSLGALSKLYLAVSKTDTTTQGLTDLKTLYENLILNHQSNVSLVKRCNYYVQKCKVLLRQYSLALAGFQQIINQNPVSYEGLVARWDYMATSLLMQGQGGAERNWDLGLPISEYIESDKSDEFDKFDNDKFTREERKQIRSAVNTALDISYTIEKKREEILTELSTRGDVTATRQLRVLRSLEQTVKVERPKNISEHLKIVTGDIQKVFINPNTGKNTNNIFIPQEFRLSQNYPNPFNPVTKISYDIPKNSMVKLIIYDILGREVKRLVNNEFKQPSRYVVEFNGTNLASGVYFYRIESGDFIQAKKMVLVK